MSRLEALQEADRRGLLTGDKKAALEAAKARGLLGATPEEVSSPDKTLNAIGGVGEPDKQDDLKADSPPFSVMYNMLRGAQTAQDAVSNAEMMGFKTRPLSDGKTFIIERDGEKYRYDPERMFTGFVGSIRPTAQTVGSMVGAVAGAPGGPPGIVAGGAGGGTAGGQLADVLVGAVEPRGTTATQEAKQAGQDVLSETSAALAGDIMGRGITAAGQGIAKLGERRAVSSATSAAAKEAAEVPTEKTYQELVDNLRTGKTKRVIPKIDPDLELKRIAEEEGVLLNPSHYSKNQAYIEVEQALKSRPGSLLNTREQQAIVRLGEVANEIKGAMGSVGDKSQLNSDYTAKIFDTIDAAKSQERTLYGKVSQAIPKQTKVNPRNTLSYLQQRAQDLGGIEYLTPDEKLVLKRFESGKVNHALLDETRKQVGEGYSKQGPFKDASGRLLDDLYGAMTKDQEGVAKVFGLEDVYQIAKKTTQDRKSLEQGVQGLFGKNAIGGDLQLAGRLEGAVAKLTKGNVADFRKTIQLVPKDMRQEAVGTSLEALFTNGARNKNNSVGQGFIAAYEQLNKNQAAKAELFQYIPKNEQDRIENLYRLSKGIYGAKRWENTSGTARAMIAAMDKEPGTLSKLYQIGKTAGLTEAAGSSVGAPGVGTAVTVATVALGAKKSAATKAADELIASPAFESALNQYARENNARAYQLLSNTKPYQKWLEAQPEPIAARVGSMGFFAWLFGQPNSPLQQTEQPSEVPPKPATP